MDAYVYYKVPVADAQTLLAKVKAMQEAIASELGIASALKRRPLEKDGCQTWMEVYIDVMEGFDATLARAVDKAGLKTWIAGERHTEHFLGLLACV